MNSNEQNSNNNIEVNSQTINNTNGNVQQTPINQNIPINHIPNEISQNQNAQNIQTGQPIQNVPIINETPMGNNETHNFHEEKDLKEVKINDPSTSQKGNFKYFLTFLLFIILFALVYFLPDISEYINLDRAKREAEKNAVVITSGTLKCELEKNDSNLDYSYSALFNFTNSKLKKLTYTITTKGDETIDNEELEKLNTDCQTLETDTSEVPGIIISCSLSRGTFTKKQIFNYQEINTENITSIYAEAGGIYPEYKLNDNIDIIEKNMKSSGYNCERIK